MAIKPFSALKFDSGNPREFEDVLTVEEVLQICVNHTPYTATMRTPGEDYPLAIGLLFTEGIFADPSLPIILRETGETPEQTNGSVNLNIPERYLRKEVVADRSIASTSSCGLCGKIDASEIRVEGVPLKPSKPLSLDRLPPMRDEMRENQVTFEKTGGSHAAAIFTVEGKLLAAAEDIGRHNATDKAIGALLEEQTLGDAECLFVSGRLSYEIITKAYAASLPFVISVSAPSSLAVETCERLGMVAIGFCRGEKATVYSNAEQVR